MSFVPERRRSRRHYSAIRAKRAEQSILDRAPPDSDGATGDVFSSRSDDEDCGFSANLAASAASHQTPRALRHREQSEPSNQYCQLWQD
jgi:hypothetical protein